MKTRLSCLAVLVLCPLLSAQSPQRARHEPRPDIRARIEALERDEAASTRAPMRLAVRVQQSSGALASLRGELQLHGSDTAARAADFAQRFGRLFDADAQTEFGAATRISRSIGSSAGWVRIPQLVNGAPLAGHGLLLLLDEDGNALAAHGLLRPSGADMAAASAVSAVSADAARDAALAHLQLDADALLGAPSVSSRAQLSPMGDVALVQRVELVRRAGLLPLVVDVDAQTGTVLSVTERRSSGTGNLLWDGAALPFVTGKGKGNVYSSVANALAGKESSASLAELTVEDVSAEAVALNGTLTGRYATVSDLDAILFSASRSFPFVDNSGALVGGSIAEYEAFDHVNAYSWITRMAGWLGKVQGGLAADTCIPVIVNYDDGGDGYVNAFYSPLDLDGGGGGFGAGYFVFGDFDAVTGDPRDDFSRDPSVACHEYTHGAVDKAGLNFGDEALDTPARAVNEAIADYAAASYLKDARIGRVFMAAAADDLFLQGDALRDLSLPLTLQDNLFDTLGFTTGLPEEHEAGEIFGAALWRARTALKSKSADDLILNGLPGWPQSNAEAGFPAVTIGNADAAYAAFFHQCFASMLDGLLLAPDAGAAQQKRAGKLLGAALAHGITGAGSGVPGVDETLYEIPGAAAGLSLAFTSEFLGSLSVHRFALELTAGQTLSVSIKGAKSTLTQVDFAFDDAPGDFTFGAEKKAAAGGTSASQSKIAVNTSRTFVVSLSNPGAGAGGYSFKLKAK